MPFQRLAKPYKRWEDAYGLAVASVMIAVGVFLLHAARIITGGTVGLALLLSQVSEQSYGSWSIALNLPLFVFGYETMGRQFIIKSLAVTIMTALLVAMMPNWLTLISIGPAFAAIAGGTIVGMGALAAARHGAAAGGTLVIVLWLQRRFGINGGSTQLAFDLLIAVSAALALGWTAALWSTLGIFATDAMIMIWHRPQPKRSDKKLVSAP